MNVCDLLSLIKDRTTRNHKRRNRRTKAEIHRRNAVKLQQLCGFGQLSKTIRLGGLVREAESTIRANAEAEIRKKIMFEVKRRLERQLQSIGDTTLSIEEIAQLWESSGKPCNAEELIFGNTPLRECMFEVAKRFERESKSRGQDTAPVLFVLSDGDPTDGDPLPALDQLKPLGVTVISCFVTDQDIANPRVLFGEPNYSGAAALNSCLIWLQQLKKIQPLQISCFAKTGLSSLMHDYLCK